MAGRSTGNARDFRRSLGRGSSHPRRGEEEAEGSRGRRDNRGKATVRTFAQQHLLEQGETSQRSCHFGLTKLPIYEESDSRRYRPLSEKSVDKSQQCLLDNILNADTRQKRLSACCALNYYFSKIMQAPMGKNFAYYALLTGHEHSIHSSYFSLQNAKSEVEEGVKLTWKGFYSFKEAADYILTYAEPGDEITWDEDREPREGLLMEAHLQEIRGLEDEVQRLNDRLEALTQGEGSSTSPTPQEGPSPQKSRQL